MRPSKKVNTLRSCEFIEKLQQMLKNDSEYVQWIDGGECLLFANLEEFGKIILPRYFRHQNILSFIRQLNMYSFHKCDNEDPSQMIFKHDIFYQGNDSNYQKIVRKNRFRDQVISQMNQNLGDTLASIRKQSLIPENLKQLLFSAIQHHQMVSKATEKVKVYLDDINDKLKNTRCKEAKVLNDKLQEYTSSTLLEQIKKLSTIQKFVKNELCKNIHQFSFGSFNFFRSQLFFSDEPKTINGFGRLNNRNSKDSLILENPEFDFDPEDDMISLEQDLEKEEENEHMFLPRTMGKIEQNNPDITTGL